MKAIYEIVELNDVITTSVEEEECCDGPFAGTIA